jgi:hypothetical protein
VQRLAPVALAVVVMLPRLASAQFGLLDDGLTLATGRETLDRWSSVLTLIPETGRFFPAYWLSYAAVFGVVGVRPHAFFAVNILLLAVLLVLLARLVRVAGGTRRHAAVALVVFAVCGPAIEAFYTLSKAEPLQLMWIAISLLAAAAAARERRWPARAALLALTGAALLVSHATKETSLVLVPISLGWLAIEWASRAASPAASRFARGYAAVSVAAAAAFLLLRAHYAALPLGQGWYTRAYTLQAETVGPALFRLAAWVMRDFAFVLPLLAAALVALRGRPTELARPILYACAWMAGWLAVYAPWPATFEYYLLPFAFGAAMFTGLVAGELWQARARGAPSATRGVVWPMLAASALLWMATVMNAAADARVQLAVDRANADLIDALAPLPRGTHVVLNTDVNEYLYELPLHLSELKHRSDLVVVPISAPAARGGTREGQQRGDVVVITPRVADPPRPTVRIAVHEGGAGRDAARLRELLDAGGTLLYTTERRADVIELGMHRLLCRVARPPFADPTYCPGDRGVVAVRTFTYGWQVHAITRSAVRRVEMRP